MFAIVSLVVAGLLAAIVVLIIRGRRVSAPTAETPQIVYFEINVIVSWTGCTTVQVPQKCQFR